MLTVSEAADRLGCSRWLIYKLIREGELPSVKVGRRNRRIMESDLERYVESKKSAT